MPLAMQVVDLNIDHIVQQAKEVFPDPENADSQGLLAAGGDLSHNMLLMAYSLGAFPWFSDGSPILWWSPDPRVIFYPGQIKLSKSLRKTIDSQKFTLTMDRAFNRVIEQCSSIDRPGQDGSWITGEMLAAYKQLHKKGFAHSVETWNGRKLVGGLYGLSIGGAFFGESMFHLETDASKVAFYHLSQKLASWNFDFIDGQVPNPHLASLGAVEIARTSFLLLLQKSIRKKTNLGSWA